MALACLIAIFVFTSSCKGGFAITEEPRCDFPPFLQTSPTKSWLLNHTDTLVTYYVSGGLLTAYDCRKDNSECSQYNRICWKSFSHNRYLVKHLESDFKNRFLCIQFFERSKSVVQIKISHTQSGHLGKFLCQFEHLELDPWPWISEEHSVTEATECPFVGGYNFDLFKFSDYRRHKMHTKCTSALPPVRVESNCETEEGMTFQFRSPSCLHDEGNFDVHQNSQCIASWSHGEERFGIIRKDSDRYYWCIRVKFGGGQEVTKIVVFLDLICDHTMNFTSTRRYIELEKLEKRKVTLMCTDEYYGCEVLNELCTVLSDLCARTCGGCNASHKANSCEFPPRIQGSWFYNNGNLLISEKTITFPRFREYECVTFQEKVEPLRRVILRRYTNGCYPRFMCVHYDVPAPSIMRFRVGNLDTWPTNLSDDSICDRGKFLQFPDIRSEVIKPYFRPFQSLIKLSSPLYSVSCNLPGLLPQAIIVYDDFGVTSCLIHGTYARPRELILAQIRDDKVQRPQIYTCIGSLTFIGSYKSIVTVTKGRESEYICWIIVNPNFILQVSPLHCNTVTAQFIMSGRSSYDDKLIRSFYITYPNSSNTCSNYFDKHYAYKPRWQLNMMAYQDSLTSSSSLCINFPTLSFVMYFLYFCLF